MRTCATTRTFLMRCAARQNMAARSSRTFRLFTLTVPHRAFYIHAACITRVCCRRERLRTHFAAARAWRSMGNVWFCVLRVSVASCTPTRCCQHTAGYSLRARCANARERALFRVLALLACACVLAGGVLDACCARGRTVSALDAREHSYRTATLPYARISK